MTVVPNASRYEPAHRGPWSGGRIDFSRTVMVGSESDYLGRVVKSQRLATGGDFSSRAISLLNGIHPTSSTVLTTSCTSALELASVALGLGPGDEVLVPAYTFVSSAVAFSLGGATPVFVDVDPWTLALDPEAAEAAISSRTRAVCVVHYGGVPARIEAVASLATRHNLVLIEDNAHGLGGKSNGKTLGTFGAFSALSFGAQKNVTCGEGGALIVNDPELWSSVEVAKERGTNKSRFLRGEVPTYEWVGLGANWNLNELAAAVLVAQLEAMDTIQARRHAIWDSYSNGLRSWAVDIGVRLPLVPAGSEHTAHVFHLRFGGRAERDRFIAHMDDAGITVLSHYHALNTSEMGRSLGGREGQCPVAEDAAETLVRLPLHIELSSDDVERVVAAATAFR